MTRLYAIAPFINTMTFTYLGVSLSLASPPLMHEVAKKAERSAGAPRYGDVCFRYGWIRENHFPTVEDAKQAITAFHATRVDWFYTGSHTMQEGAVFVQPAAKNFIDWCHSHNMKICGTINSKTLGLPQASSRPICR